MSAYSTDNDRNENDHRLGVCYKCQSPIRSEFDSLSCRCAFYATLCNNVLSSIPSRVEMYSVQHYVIQHCVIKY